MIKPASAPWITSVGTRMPGNVPYVEIAVEIEVGAPRIRASTSAAHKLDVAFELVDVRPVASDEPECLDTLLLRSEEHPHEDVVGRTELLVRHAPRVVGCPHSSGE
jgi:hypothetical protein